MSKTVTRKDITKPVNVSPTIISYVLNSSSYVNQKKREKVLETVRRLNYIPSQLARRLRTSRSAQFILVCDNIRAELFEAIETGLFERGYYISLNYSRNIKEFLDMLIGRQPEGIFVMANMFGARQLNSIAMNGIPIILYRIKHYEKLDPRAVTIVPDYYDAMRRSVGYPALKGHTCIGMVPPAKYLAKGTEGDGFRVKVYVEALRCSSISIGSELICIRTQTMDDIYEEVFHILVSSEEDGKPTALMVGDDYFATQIMQYLKRLSISVPGNLPVIGCDSTQIVPLTTSTLTAVDASEEKLVKTYVDKMLVLVEEQQTEGEYTDMKPVIRESI